MDFVGQSVYVFVVAAQTTGRFVLVFTEVNNTYKCLCHICVYVEILSTKRHDMMFFNINLP